VKVISTEEEAKQYSIFDVVLPLPGTDVQYPTNDVGAAYTELMSADGINASELSFTKVRDFSLTGSYRKIMCLPADVEYSVHSYDDMKIPLLLTDKEVLDGKTLDVPNEVRIPFSVCILLPWREITF